jgi:hypothetical protein
MRKQDFIDWIQKRNPPQLGFKYSLKISENSDIRKGDYRIYIYVHPANEPLDESFRWIDYSEGFKKFRIGARDMMEKWESVTIFETDNEEIAFATFANEIIKYERDPKYLHVWMFGGASGLPLPPILNINDIEKSKTNTSNMQCFLRTFIDTMKT